MESRSPDLQVHSSPYLGVYRQGAGWKYMLSYQIEGVWASMHIATVSDEEGAANMHDHCEILYRGRQAHPLSMNGTPLR